MPKTGEIAVGVIAQEVEKTNPNLVKTRWLQMQPEDKDKSEIKAVDYSKFSLMLINAVKELYQSRSIFARKILGPLFAQLLSSPDRLKMPEIPGQKPGEPFPKKAIEYKEIWSMTRCLFSEHGRHEYKKSGPNLIQGTSFR